MAITQNIDGNIETVGTASIKINKVIISQEQGQSTTDVMSQKAVTDEIEKINNKLEEKTSFNEEEYYTKKEIDENLIANNIKVYNQQNDSNNNKEIYVMYDNYGNMLQELSFMRNEDGSYKLDENGNKIPIYVEGEFPVLDEYGEPVLDEDGNPLTENRIGQGVEHKRISNLNDVLHYSNTYLSAENIHIKKVETESGIHYNDRTIDFAISSITNWNKNQSRNIVNLTNKLNKLINYDDANHTNIDNLTILKEGDTIIDTHVNLYPAEKLYTRKEVDEVVKQVILKILRNFNEISYDPEKFFGKRAYTPSSGYTYNAVYDMTNKNFVDIMDNDGNYGMFDEYGEPIYYRFFNIAELNRELSIYLHKLEIWRNTVNTHLKNIEDALKKE